MIWGTVYSGCNGTEDKKIRYYNILKHTIIIYHDLEHSVLSFFREQKIICHNFIIKTHEAVSVPRKAGVRRCRDKLHRPSSCCLQP